MTAPSTQVTTLLTQFGLTTAAEELVPRRTQAGHPEAMPVLLEVLEAEAEARRQRRIARLHRAARLPPGKTFATLDTGRLPAPVVQQLETLATGAFLKHRLAAFERKVAEDGVVLTEAQFAALEQKRDDEEAHVEIETAPPGYLGGPGHVLRRHAEGRRPD